MNLKIILLLFSFLALSFSCYNKKDYIALDSIAIKHFNQQTLEDIKKDIGFDNPENFLRASIFEGEIIPRLKDCRLDSAGFISETQENYAFLSCSILEKQIRYFAIVSENDGYSVGLFENMSGYITHPHIIISVFLFLIVLIIGISFLRKMKFKKIFFICMLVNIYVLLMQFTLLFFPDSIITYIMGLFQLFVNLILYFFEIQAKYPVWYSILQFICLQCMYILLYYGFNQIKERKKYS